MAGGWPLRGKAPLFRVRGGLTHPPRPPLPAPTNTPQEELGAEGGGLREEGEGYLQEV